MLPFIKDQRRLISGKIKGVAGGALRNPGEGGVLRLCNLQDSTKDCIHVVKCCTGYTSDPLNVGESSEGP